ncbi:hypothetical protein BT96DRAFT_222379 [Gymnopus androsaceus JB14]|uniref:Rhodopsin domain-containing protein n=1 Tax=Gymnopus androsaceus JB14 TaxID=1447944 RepID=A0A6A4I7M8_9AGAR|nr:hypothetical protein BT96DRAFT_222379 [Gymnopus androsaceus JB14]
MVNWVQPSPTTNRIVTTTLIGIAQILTVFRFYVRYRSKRLWWDDAWTLLTVLLSYLLLISMWVRTDTPALGPIHQSHSARIVAYWLLYISFTCTLWSARMSLIFSVIRLIPPLFKLRKVSEWTAVVFFFMWAGSLTQKTYVCASDRSWYQLAQPQCHLGTKVGIVELITDLFADTSLVVIPIRLLQGVGISSEKRRMLHIMFGASLLISLVSVLHAVFLLGPSGLLEAITAQAEAVTALIVANLGVLSPYAYRLMKNGEDFDSKPYTYYHSFQANGEVEMRRMPRSLEVRANRSALRFQVTTSVASEAEFQVSDKSGPSSVRELEVQSKPPALSSTAGNLSSP